MEHRGIFLLVVCILASVVLSLQETTALPQGCATGGTKISLRAGGAALLLDSSSNFKVQAKSGVDSLVFDSSNGGLATFKGDVSFGPIVLTGAMATPACRGTIGTLNGDIVAYVNPTPGKPLGWTSLSISSPITLDTAAAADVLNEFYEINTCGKPGDTVKARVDSCNALDVTELQAVRQLQAITNSATNGAADPLYPFGATAFVDPVSQGVVTAFGAPDSTPDGAGFRRTIILRTTPTPPAKDYTVAGAFKAYSIYSFDPAVPALYSTFEIDNTKTTTPPVSAVREFWISNTGWDSSDPAFSPTRPSGILISYNCPGPATLNSYNCDSIVFLANEGTAASWPFQPQKPDPIFVQSAPILPAGFTQIGVNRHPQLIIDASGGFHVFWITTTGTAPTIDNVYYSFCRVTYGADPSAFNIEPTKDCKTTLITSQPGLAIDAGGPRLQAKFFKGQGTTGPTIVVAAYLRDSRLDNPAGATFIKKAVYLYTFTPSATANTAWGYTTTTFPPNSSPVGDSSPQTRFTFPTSGRLYDFSVALTDDATTTTQLSISYSYTRYANNYSNKKRATPGNPDLSREEFVFRTILCPEFRCLTFTARQLLGSRNLFHNYYGTVPTGFVGLISSKYNKGNPTFGFSVGSGDNQRDPRNALAPLLPGYDVSGGPIGVINCADALCNSASLQRSSDYLSGHRGEFIFAPTPDGVLVGSIPVVAGRRSPIYQAYKNESAAPTRVVCSGSIVGQQRSIDGEVFVCTALPDSPILDATAMFYWASVAPSLQSMVSVSPINFSNQLAALDQALPTC